MAGAEGANDALGSRELDHLAEDERGTRPAGLPVPSGPADEEGIVSFQGISP